MLVAIDQFGISLGPDQPSAERRLDRRDQQPVVAPRQGAGDGAGRIAAETVGEPPFAALRLIEIAADRAAKTDYRGNGEALWGGVAVRCAVLRLTTLLGYPRCRFSQRDHNAVRPLRPAELRVLESGR